jgi:tetratricopeptide (TPR) repeat protein
MINNASNQGGDHAASPSTADTMRRAVALHQDGKLAQAAALYLEIIAAEPDHADALHMLGVYALQSGDLQAALDLIGRATALLPQAATPLLNLGTVHKQLGQHDAALRCITQALALEPRHATALNNYGSVLLAMQRYSDALPWFERALDVDADDADAWNNLGNALLELQRHEEALLCLDRALRLQPRHLHALFNRGNALQFLNRSAAALDSYAAALELDPGHVDANFNMGVCRLLDGDLERGWPQYEWRWRKPAYASLIPAGAQPLWHGQCALDGKTLLVYAEQGYGDTLHLCRYVPLLAARGARVILRVQPALKTLLSVLPGAHQVLASDQPLPGYDLHCPLMSLPLAFGTRLATIPADRPYVHADPQRSAQWRARLGPAAKPRVGLAWAGSSGHANDRLRSMPLIALRRILTPAMEFISLQKELRTVDRLLLDGAGIGISQYAAQQSDFADTAALVAQMDLVICVDTAIAHLAGAMGKPVWLLLPFAPDWRWMLGRDDSPWYPSMRLFRQTRSGDWDDVLDAVARQLAQG